MYSFIAANQPVMQHEIDRFGKAFKHTVLNRLLAEGYIAYDNAKTTRSNHTTLVTTGNGN